MGRKPKQERSAEEKLAIVMEGVKSGNVAETCRKFEIAPSLFYRWKDEVEGQPWLRLGGGAQPRGPMKSRASVSSNWSGRWAAAPCRSRS